MASVSEVRSIESREEVALTWETARHSPRFRDVSR